MHQNQKKKIWVLSSEIKSRKGALASLCQKMLLSDFDVECFDTLEAFSQSLLQKKPDLLVTDITLSDGSFIHFLEEEKFTVPFLIVSHTDDLSSFATCYKIGARDYVTRPFNTNELFYKIRRCLDQESSMSKLKIDSINNLVSQNGVEVHLTPKELQILSLLSKKPEQLKTRAEIIQSIWGGTAVTEKTLDVHLFNLRRKMLLLNLDIQHVEPGAYTLLDTSSK